MKKINFENGEFSCIEVRNLSLDKNDKDNILLKVKYSGLCGSDVQKIKLIEREKSSSVTLGHEIVAEVFETNNKTYVVGETVVVMPIIFCGKCKYCISGDIQFCFENKNLGKSVDGGFVDFMLVPHKCLYKVKSNTINLVLADPLACIIHGLHSFKDFKPLKVCIIGDGTIAELAIRYLVKPEIEIVNLVKSNLSKSQFSIKLSFNEVRENKEFIDHFDLVIDCVGGASDEVLNLATVIAKKKGTILVFGVYEKDYLGKLNFREVFGKELCLLGSRSFAKCNSTDEFKESIRLIESEEIDLDEIITNKLPLEEFGKGIELFTNKISSKARKIVFTFEG